MMSRAPTQGVSAIVPVKRLDSAKSRLASIMTPAERQVLAEAMLLDVLDVLSSVKGIAMITIVTGDAALAARAQALDVRVIDDPLDAGTNMAVTRGLETVTAEGCRSALVVPGDIPFLAAVEVEAVIAALARAAVVLAPARRDGGTNLLGLSPPDIIAPAFGPLSFARHIALASAMGVKPVILPSTGAGHDIDVPSDLTPDIGGGPAPRTRALLKQSAILEKSLLS